MKAIRNLKLTADEVADLVFALEQHLITIEQEPDQLEECMDGPESLAEHELNITKILYKAQAL